jgi:small subunit ribosomal protein S6
MPLYEVTFIARQDLSKQDVSKIADGLGEIIAKSGGTVVKNEYWGLRSLAYKVNKSRKGHYVMLGIDAPAVAIKEVERTLRINEEVIRTLTIAVDAIEEGPSAMLQQARSREDSPAEAEAQSSGEEAAA